MVSPFSNDIKQLIYNLIFLPSKDDLQILSLGTDKHFFKNIIDGIACKESEKSFSKDFISPFLIFDNINIKIWEILYPEDDKEYDDNDLRLLRNYSVINTIETIVFYDKANNKLIADTPVVLISSKYIQYLTKKYGMMERNPKLIDYITEILYNVILCNLNHTHYYSKGVLIMFIGFYGASVLLTYIGLAFSVTGMVLAFLGHIPAAVMCLILAGVCDMFDGTVARACKRSETEKKFGIQIDSLVDTVSFGVFPIVLGICMGFTSKLNTVIYVIYGLAAVIRLAYFNVLAEEKTVFNKRKKEKVSYYFGLPVTSIAIILPFTYNLNIFMHPSVFLKAYPLVMLMTAILFVLNIKIKKPTGIWYVICSILAVIEIAIISAAMR